MTPAALRMTLCPACDTPQALEGSVACVDCSRCYFRFTAVPALFGEQQWASEKRPSWMAGCLHALELILSSRKRRLLYTTVACTGFDTTTNNLLRIAIKVGEDWADFNRPNFGCDDLRRLLQRRMPRRGSKGWDWRQLALGCLETVPSYRWENFQEVTQALFADSYRDLIPNPFLPLTWDPDWFTSTVRQLASHIYSRHEFTTMPILADALQDAGCEDEQILNHCRAEKPHARGCWVLDAILGKA